MGGRAGVHQEVERKREGAWLSAPLAERGGVGIRLSRRATSEEECSYHFYFDKPTNDLSSKQANFNGNHPDGKGEKGHTWSATKVGSYAPNSWVCTTCMVTCCNGARICTIRRLGPGVRGGGWSLHGSDCRRRSGSARAVVPGRPGLPPRPSSRPVASRARHNAVRRRRCAVRSAEE